MGFIVGGCMWIGQEFFGFFIIVVVYKVGFFGSSEGVGDFGRQLIQNINFGEVENFLSGFWVGVDWVEFDINVFYFRCVGFGMCFVFGVVFNGSVIY